MFQFFTKLFASIFCCLVLLLFVIGANAEEQRLTVSEVAESLTQHAMQNRFPSQLVFKLDGKSIVGSIRYTFDSEIHQQMAKTYLQYQPDFACFVAIDVETGAIINLTSFIKGDESYENLVMRSDYPAASVFKVVTAAAGLDSGKLKPTSVIPYNGKSTTLYKRQVLRHKKNKWTREPTLKEAFAKSINPVFARIGVFTLGGKRLKEYANKFGFEQSLQTDFELPISQLGLSFDDQWQIAEAASGFTKDITLSPIHAAQMAAIIANDGKMVRPYMVERVIDKRGELIYQTRQQGNEQVISSQAAQQLKQLMQATTKIGSARSSFSGLKRYKVYRNMKIGGKTGSLTGFSPKGRHDWFMGFAEKDGKQVAYASLIVNKEKWYVRSAYVARQFIYNYFMQQQIKSDQQVTRN